jgi:hypothetical protein
MAMNNMFRKAVKEEAKLLMAVSGPSGAGKTYTALRFATELAGLGGRIAVVDTEHGSASKYADLFSFDTLHMEPPYHPARFAEAARAAKAAGYDVLVIDSLSHAWAGSGGALEMVDEEAKKIKGNSYMAWGAVTPVHRNMVDTIVSVGGPDGMHVIVTMRSKTEYVLEQDARGKTVPRKVGMAPIQRDGTEYEFDVWIEMTIDNDGIVQKTRCPELTGRVFSKPGNEVTDILKEWLKGAAPLTQDEYEAAMLAATDAGTWAYNAHRLNVVNSAFAMPQNLVDFRGYLGAEVYGRGENEQVWSVLRSYSNAILDGGDKRDAATAARMAWAADDSTVKPQPAKVQANGQAKPQAKAEPKPVKVEETQPVTSTAAAPSTPTATARIGKDPAELLKATGTEIDADMLSGGDGGEGEDDDLDYAFADEDDFAEQDALAEAGD